MTFYWAPPHTDIAAWPEGWVVGEPELSDDEYELLRMPTAGRTASFTFRATRLQAWRWYRMFTGRRHPRERRARQQYVRRLRARRRRARR